MPGVWKTLRSLFAVFVALLTYVPSIAAIAHAKDPAPAQPFAHVLITLNQSGSLDSYAENDETIVASHLSGDEGASTPYDGPDTSDSNTSFPPTSQMSEVETEDHLDLNEVAAHFKAPTETLAAHLNHRLEGVVLPLTRKPPDVA